MKRNDNHQNLQRKASFERFHSLNGSVSQKLRSDVSKATLNTYDIETTGLFVLIWKGWNWETRASNETITVEVWLTVRLSATEVNALSFVNHSVGERRTASLWVSTETMLSRMTQINGLRSITLRRESRAGSVDDLCCKYPGLGTFLCDDITVDVGEEKALSSQLFVRQITNRYN